MSHRFDPYYRWLGIPPKDQPPHHYRLLAIDLFEPDVEVIATAADRQMAYLRTFQTGKNSALSQKLLNEVASARLCLLNPAKRAAYDEALRQRLEARATMAGSSFGGSSVMGGPLGAPALGSTGNSSVVGSSIDPSVVGSSVVGSTLVGASPMGSSVVGSSALGTSSSVASKASSVLGSSLESAGGPTAPGSSSRSSGGSSKTQPLRARMVLQVVDTKSDAPKPEDAKADDSEGKFKVSPDVFEPESVLAFPAIPPPTAARPWQNLSAVMMTIIGVSPVVSLTLFGWIFWMLGHPKAVADAQPDATVAEAKKEPAKTPEKTPEKASETTPEKPPRTVEKAKPKEKAKENAKERAREPKGKEPPAKERVRFKPSAAVTATSTAASRGTPPLAVFPFEARVAKLHQQRWADHVKVPVVDTNVLGMRFTFIPPGKYEMGSRRHEVVQMIQSGKSMNLPSWYVEGLHSETPHHRVVISRPFYLGTCPVTQGQYQRIMGANPSDFCATGGQKSKVAGQNTLALPVENVTWDNAVEFCSKLSALPREKVAKHVYRLPTEAEWEYAARAGIQQQFLATELGEFLWYGDNSGGRTHPVGAKKPNAWGLHDMFGNVNQWCADWYGPRYYHESPAVDPAGPTSGVQRVARGGAWWMSEPAYFRCAMRHHAPPGIPTHSSGFRVVRVIEP